MPKRTVEEIEETYGIHSREIRNALADGHISGERNHGVWSVSERSVMAAIDKGILKNRKQASQAPS